MKKEITPEQRRKYAPLFFAIMMSLALLVNLSGHIQKRKSIVIGKPIKHFEISLIDKPFNEFSPKTWAGKAVIINIFASWCQPCKLEHEYLIKLSKATSIPIYGIAWKDEEKKINAYLSQYGNPYQLVGYDSQGATTLPFSMTGVPETTIIDANGLVVFHYTAALDEYVITTQIMPLLQQLEKPHVATP